jgi:hypothetical protein
VLQPDKMKRAISPADSKRMKFRNLIIKDWL